MSETYEVTLCQRDRVLLGFLFRFPNRSAAVTAMMKRSGCSRVRVHQLIDRMIALLTLHGFVDVPSYTGKDCGELVTPEEL